jgi:hypothetical protein
VARDLAEITDSPKKVDSKVISYRNPVEIVKSERPNQNLPAYIRLIIYSFLTQQEIVQKVARLSREERANLSQQRRQTFKQVLPQESKNSMQVPRPVFSVQKTKTNSDPSVRVVPKE